MFLFIARRKPAACKIRSIYDGRIILHMHLTLLHSRFSSNNNHATAFYFALFFRRRFLWSRRCVVMFIKTEPQASHECWFNEPGAECFYNMQFSFALRFHRGFVRDLLPAELQDHACALRLFRADVNFRKSLLRERTRSSRVSILAVQAHWTQRGKNLLM